MYSRYSVSILILVNEPAGAKWSPVTLMLGVTESQFLFW